MKKNQSVMPVLKWVGGKRQLLPVLTPLLPKKIDSYCEPFVGGAAMLFSLQPQKAFVNDVNDDLINVYKTIQTNVDELIDILKQYKNDSEFFYSIRDLDRNKECYNALSLVEKAARILFLNKTCYNGLFRVNSSGEFNSPFGRYKNPNIVNASTLKSVSYYLNSADIVFTSQDYKNVLDNLPNGSFVYLDPPYDPISVSSNFTGYSKGGFDRSEQIRLKENCDELNKRGIKFMLSNSATDFILNEYKSYNITIVQAKRFINSVASKRGDVNEVVITNYERD